MLNWESVNSTYIYDGSFDGLLTIVFDCYKSKILPISISSKDTYSPNLLDNCILIKTDYSKAKRIFNGIMNSICYEAWFYAYSSFLSNDSLKEINIVKFLCLGFMCGPKAVSMYSIPYVLDVYKIKRRVWLEIEHLKGFLRFRKLQDNLFIATIHPDNNIIEELGYHFMKRLPTQNFIIVDKNRNLAFLYNLEEFSIVSSKELNLPEIEEENYEALWKSFVKTIAIPERRNKRLQLQYMPKRYWKDLIEKP